MKHQENQTIENQSGILQPNNLNCPHKRQASHLCINQNCSQDALICTDDECECNKLHEICPQILIKTIKKKIESKIVPYHTFEESLLQKIEKTIDELSDFREKLKQQMQRDPKLHGLTQNQKILIKWINKEVDFIYKGNEIHTMFNKLIKEENSITEKDLLEYKFTKIWQGLTAQIHEKMDKISKMLKEYEKPPQIQSNLFKTSKIISNTESRQRMVNFLDLIGIIETKLLYRASQHNFSTNKFHELCDNIPHTVVICETEYGKVIGGYTPLVWDCSGTQQKDVFGRSFLFSLSNNIIFKLDQNAVAIHRQAEGGPMFGSINNPDFCLSSKSNELKNNKSRIGLSYYNDNQDQGTHYFYQRLNGDPDGYYLFRAKDWEVWQIVFDQ